MHCMTDLETLDTRPTAHILSIGAVIFDKDRDYQKFYQVIKIDDFMMDNFTISASTLNWWLGQDEAIKEFRDSGEPIQVVLEKFSTWFKDHIGKEMWGNGATFDNVILRNAYYVCKMVPPWKYWDDCCFRTIRNRYPKIESEFVGVKHNALDDAVSQATYLRRLNSERSLNIL